MHGDGFGGIAIELSAHPSIRGDWGMLAHSTLALVGGNMAFNEGYDSYNAGFPITANPYRSDHNSYMSWIRGWQAAESDWLI